MPIDSIHRGLLIRVPSEYEASSIRLFTYNTANQRIDTGSIELAQNWGDGGNLEIKHSILVARRSAPIPPVSILTIDSLISVFNDEETDTLPVTDIPDFEGRELTSFKWLHDRFVTTSQKRIIDRSKSGRKAWPWQ